MGVLFFFALAPLHAFDSHKPFDISADVIDYQNEGQQFTAEGHVVVVQTTSTLTADFLRYDRVAGRFFARGNVILNEKGAVLAGDEMEYDLNTSHGVMHNAMGSTPPWRFQGSNWEKMRDAYVGRDASFTSCDLQDPHYHLRSSRIHVIPDRMFWAWNNVAYADTLPVFYSPFLYKYLGPRRLVFQIQPGHDGVNGAFAKTTTTFRITQNMYNKFLLDDYTRAGAGIGNEFNFQVPGKSKGSFFAYFINPHSDETLNGAPNVPQYNVRLYDWQKLGENLTFQSSSDLQKYASFNNQFFPEDTYQAATNIQNSVALTRQTRRSMQRLVVEGVQSPDVSEIGISTFPVNHWQSASLPRYDFTLFQMPLWKDTSLMPGTTSTAMPFPNARHIGPIMFNMSSSFGEQYSRVDDRLHTNGNGTMTFSDAIPLSKRWSFTPSVTPSLTWQDKVNPVAPTAVVSSTGGVIVSTGTLIPIGQFRGFQGRVGSANNLRFRPSTSLSFDQTYNWTARMEPNGTALDRSLVDGGIETNHFTELMFWRPSRTIMLRSFSGYDFRRIADEDPNLYRQRRIDPWTSELTIFPSQSHFDYFLRYALGYYPTATSQSEVLVNYHGPYRLIVQSGILYNRGLPGVVTVNQTVGIFLSPGWRLDATVHGLVPDTGFGHLGQSKMIDTQFSVVRDMHCWQAQFNYISRPPFGNQYSLTFNLKLGPENGPPIQNRDLESQFYPWRANPYNTGR